MMEITKFVAIGSLIFYFFIWVEKLLSRFQGKDTVPFMDALSSGYSGITMLAKQFLGISVAIISYSFLVKHFAVFSIEANWVNYIIAFVAIDFSGYWSHRFSHTINYFWNVHLIHHSSEEFNLACAMRQTIVDFIAAFTIFLLPAAILGVPQEIIRTIAPLHLFMQFWYHTRHIGKLGFLEYIIVTPSQHRVHHAMNPVYIDKNFSGIFCIWDRLFGTFQEELESEPPVYGITRPVQTYNPIAINFQHLLLLIKDAWRTKNWVDKFTIWFRPTGWRPQDVGDKYPVYKIDDVVNYKKFNPPASMSLKIWSNIQFNVLFFLFVYVLFNSSFLASKGFIVLVIFVFLQVFSATELMNRNKLAHRISLVSTFGCFGIYFFDNSFLGVDRISIFLPKILLVYFVLQSFMAYFFTEKEEVLQKASFETNDKEVSI